MSVVRWQVGLGLAIFIGYLLTVALIHVDGHRAAGRGETPLLTDFTSLYAASMLLRQQTAVDLYRPRVFPCEFLRRASHLGR